MPALEHPNVELLTNADVARLETSTSGREITKVIVEHKGEHLAYSADIVVSSCGAINSAALLLRSANDKHPNGLANSSDMVGRHYMCHVNTMFLALSRHKNETKFNKPLGLNDFYFATKEWEYPTGHISLVGNADANVLRAGAPRIAPGWTLELMADHAVPFWATSEDLPNRDNRVTVTPDGRIMLSYTPSNEEAHKRLLANLREILKDIEFEEYIIPLQAYIPGRIPLGSRIRTAQRDLAMIPRLRCSTSTVKRTSWKTSTSSMQVSSPLVAQ